MLFPTLILHFVTRISASYQNSLEYWYYSAAPIFQEQASMTGRLYENAIAIVFSRAQPTASSIPVRKRPRQNKQFYHVGFENGRFQAIQLLQDAVRNNAPRGHWGNSRRMLCACKVHRRPTGTYMSKLLAKQQKASLLDVGLLCFSSRPTLQGSSSLVACQNWWNRRNSNNGPNALACDHEALSDIQSLWAMEIVACLKNWRSAHVFKRSNTLGS